MTDTPHNEIVEQTCDDRHKIIRLWVTFMSTPADTLLAQESMVMWI